jgi:hypothetical protein
MKVVFNPFTGKFDFIENDHGKLIGLSDDDHSQYLLLSGRSGQEITDDITINNGSSEQLTLKNPNDATGARNAALNFDFSDGDGAVIRAVRPSVGSNTDVVLNFFAGGNTSTRKFQIEADGSLNVGATTNYETLVTDDDDIPNKKYVDDEISALVLPDDIFSVTSNVVSNSGANSTIGTDDFVFGSDSLDDSADVTKDARFQFDKSKGAFYAGSATGTEWDTRGDNTINLGKDSQTTIANCISLGNDNDLLGPDEAIGIGYRNTQSGIGQTNVIQLGSDNVATGSNNIAIGSSNDTSGGSFAIGGSNETSGGGAVALGNSCTALDQAAVTIGLNSTNDGRASFCQGEASSIGNGADNCVAMGASISVTSQDDSFTVGNFASNSASNGMVMGFNSSATATDGVAIGRSAGASGTQALAFGRTSSSEAVQSFVVGVNLRATADGAMAIGRGQNVASSQRLLANIANTMFLGMNSTKPTMVLTDSGGSNQVGKVGIVVTNPDSQLHVDQSNSSGAMPVLHLDQADISEEFIKLTGNAAAATLTQSFVAEADVTTATRQGFLKIEINDKGNQITDGAYFIPFFSLA